MSLVVAVIFLVGIAVACLVTGTAFHRRGHDGWAVASFLLSFGSLVVTVAFGLQAHADNERSGPLATAGSTTPGSSTGTARSGDEPGPPPTGAGDGASTESVSLAEVSVTSKDGTTATAYFGQLAALLDRLGPTVALRTDPTYRQEHGGQCAATVVVEGIEGAQGTVVARGLSGDWGGAEPAPDAGVGPGRVLHQQLVVPPTQASPGTAWTASATVEVDGASFRTGSYRLTFAAEDGDQQRWTLDSTPVTCTT